MLLASRDYMIARSMEALKDGKDLRTIVFFVKEGELRLIVMCPDIYDDDQKAAMWRQLAAMTSSFNCDGFCLLADVWASSYPASTDFEEIAVRIEDGEMPRPADDPEHTEMLMVLRYERSKKMRTEAVRYERKDNGRLRFHPLEPLGDGAEGRLAELLIDATENRKRTEMMHAVGLTPRVFVDMAPSIHFIAAVAHAAPLMDWREQVGLAIFGPGGFIDAGPPIISLGGPMVVDDADGTIAMPHWNDDWRT